MKRKIQIFILLLILFIPGCYDYSDLKNTSFCFGIALDYGKDKKYHITLETGVLMYQSSGAKFQTIVNESEGDTLNDAIAAMSATTSSLIDYTHCQLFIISKDIASEGLKLLTEDLFNNVRLQNNINILISNCPTAGEILKTKSVTNASLSFEIIYSLSDTSDYYALTFKKRLVELYNDLHSDFEDYLIPSIQTRKSGEDVLASLEGAFIMEEGKIKEFINNEEMICAMIMQMKLPNFLKTIEYNEEYISFKINKISRKIKTSSKNKKLLNFDFNLTATIMHNLTDPYDGLDRLEKLLTEEIIEMFRKYQRNNIDIFRLKYYLYKYHNKQYDQVKEDDLIDFDININFKIKLKEKGMLL